MSARRRQGRLLRLTRKERAKRAEHRERTGKLTGTAKIEAKTKLAAPKSKKRRTRRKKDAA